MAKFLYIYQKRPDSFLREGWLKGEKKMGEPHSHAISSLKQGINLIKW